MARTIYGHVEVGRRVYQPYAPARAGVIIEVTPQEPRMVKSRGCNAEYRYTPPPMVTVKWVDGKTTDTPSLSLQDFDALVEDCQQKLETHLATKAKLENLAKTLGTCDRPPSGWSCSREPGHPGPCAASPTEAK